MTKHDFEIGSAADLEVSDQEIRELLDKVYVAGGYTSAEDAVSMFDPAAVRRRGMLIAARDKSSLKLAGFIIFVPPGSPAIKLARGREGELHLLGVAHEFRENGLGSQLLQSAIKEAKCHDCPKLILWTQLAMIAAQRVYEASGFIHTGNFERNGREFKIYELSCG